MEHEPDFNSMFRFIAGLCTFPCLYIQTLRERIIWPVCLLVRVTIRGIRNLVSSLPSIEATIRGREGADT